MLLHTLVDGSFSIFSLRSCSQTSVKLVAFDGNGSKRASEAILNTVAFISLALPALKRHLFPNQHLGLLRDGAASKLLAGDLPDSEIAPV